MLEQPLVVERSRWWLSEAETTFFRTQNLTYLNCCLRLRSGNNKRISPILPSASLRQHKKHAGL